MKSYLDKESAFRFECPQCRHEIIQKIGWLDNRDHFICSACQSYIPLSDDSKLRLLSEHANAIAKAMERLRGK